MKKLILLSILVLPVVFLLGQNDTVEPVMHSPENSKCFKCHGGVMYSYFNDILGRNVTKRMNPYFIIDSVLFYESNHKPLVCTDCHSYDYNTFPHNSELRMEPMLICLDCHEGDPVTAKFNFDQINEEFQKSVHSTKHSDDFTCWMCHNPHSYKINARTNENVKETIVYDNNICLSCHANVNKYHLITRKKNPSVIQSHDWLPNQIAHFASVRCIECHTHETNDVLVAHEILPKDQAVKKCVECHSKNSLLMASLYKYAAKEKRSNYGFNNSAILQNSYIIGANRNYYLNLLSIVIFGGVLVVIIIHAILRMLTK